MAKREPVVINGQPIGRIKASWLLFKEAWRYLRADNEMLWIPIITGILNLFLFGILITVFVLIVLGGDVTLSAEGEPASPAELAFIFVCYVIGAFTLALAQSGITHTVYTRAHGGDATLGESLKVAFSHWFSLLIWSLITSTVGVIIRFVAERSKLAGKLVMMLIGGAWSVLTYFVVPAMVIDKKSAFGSIGKSGSVFKNTWGETIVSNISLGVVFLIVYVLSIISGIGLIIAAAAMEAGLLAVIVMIILFIWFVLVSLVQSAMQGVLKTLLYMYASEGTPPPNFNQELLDKMMARKEVVATVPQTSIPPNTGSVV